MCWDFVGWLIAVPLAVELRFDFSPPAGSILTSVVVGLICGVLQLVLGLFSRIYKGRYVTASFDEVTGLLYIAIGIGIAWSVTLIFLPGIGLPRSAVFIGSLLALTWMLAGRFTYRSLTHLRQRFKPGLRTVIYGAGDAGIQIAGLLLSQESGMRPVAFIDDDPHKRHRRFRGLRVYGSKGDLRGALVKLQARVVLVAMTGIDSRALLELEQNCREVGVTVRVIPTVSEISNGTVKLDDISELTDEDLLGRRPVWTDEEAIAKFFRSRRILVTGAGGSIGSELSRQLCRYDPACLLLLDRDESALLATRRSIGTNMKDHCSTLILADIRDGANLTRIFLDHKPEIVFHAAALKHLNFLEIFPREAYLTNVLGTQNVLDASAACSTTTYVNISTDKAAEPTNHLGWSKLITERMTAARARQDAGRFLSVRFGNVLGSRGSVLETFRFQIASGGPVTVTDPNVTRFFMTIREAVHLVLQAAVIGKSGETLVLDMGEPVSILSVAERLIARSGKNISIEFTGLNQGEKLAEVLTNPNEDLTNPIHELIYHSRVQPLNGRVQKIDDPNCNFRAELIKLAVGD